MKNVVCWKIKDVPEVMNTEAEYTQDYVFAAVHTPVSIVKRLTDQTNSIQYSQEDLLKEFTSAENKHLIVPVLGKSGSGKSHLVHWLKTYIQPIPLKQEVIFIPKAGTNLKHILGLILQNRQGDVFDEYRRRLQEATEQLSPDAGREKLLNQIAETIRHQFDVVEGKLDDSLDKSFLPAVRRSLPDLLYDPHFRGEFWLSEGGVIQRLFDLALGTGGARERLEDRRKFDRSDLPIESFDNTPSGAVVSAFANKLAIFPELQDLCLAVLNATLDEAIRKLLIGGQDLRSLMTDVRVQLHQEGLVLILLIEDFAKMQGIDTAILEAIIEQSTPAKKLCPIRVAMACTDGYYANLPDTFRTRVSFTVWVEYNDEGVNYNTFVARYLNAARVGAATLLDDFNRFQQTGEHQEWIAPNACLGCEYQPQCHPTFGAVEGMGLYPFNEVAAQNLYRRINRDSFTPRELIRSVLREVTLRFAPAIAAGNFPNQEFLQQYGNRINSLQASDQQAIRNKHGQATAQRLEPLVEFWSSRSRSLPSGILEAFDLPPINLSTSAKSTTAPVPTRSQPQPVTEEKTTTANPSYPDQYYKLEHWRNGHALDQNTRRELRKDIYNALSDFISWDDLGLIRSEFFGAGTVDLFKENKIEFLSNEGGTKSHEKIHLLLPLAEEERIETTIALQALVLFRHYGNWHFDTDRTFFLALAKHLKRWSDHIVDQLPVYSGIDPTWNPIRGILQWLYLTARLCGNLKHDTSSVVEIWEQINQPVDFKNTEFRSASMGRLLDRLKVASEKLRTQLYAYTLCPKGQSTKVKYFNIARVIPGLQWVHRKGKLSYLTPADVPRRFETLQKVDADLPLFEQALSDETDAHLSVLSVLEEAFGAPEEVSTIFRELKSTLEEIENQGLGHLLNKPKYEDARRFLSQPISKLDQVFRNLLQLQPIAMDKDTNLREITSRLGRGDLLKIMDDARVNLATLSELLDTVNVHINKEIETKKSANEGNVESSKAAIQEALDWLEHMPTNLPPFND